MAAYTGIQGQNILIVSSDPANPTEGQIWYNSTTNLLKGYANVVTNAWASGGNLPTATDNNAAAGTQTAAITFGGSSPVGDPTAASYLYNGTSWTPSPALNTGRRYLMGCGSQTSALAIGGFSTAATGATELWNGTSWTSNPTGLTRPTSFYDGAAAGTQTSSLVFGGEPTSAATESWNGTSWTSTGSLNTARFAVAGSGVQTAALAFGGASPSTGATESYNGSSWTTSPNSLNTARASLESAVSGTQTASLGFGGEIPPITGATELWNGTSWTTSPGSLATARTRGAGAGNQTSALMMGGANPAATRLTATEEWTGTAVAVRTITTS